MMIPTWAGSIFGIIIYLIILPVFWASVSLFTFYLVFRSPELTALIPRLAVRRILATFVGVLLTVLWWTIHISYNWGFPHYNYGPGP